MQEGQRAHANDDIENSQSRQALLCSRCLTADKADFFLKLILFRGHLFWTVDICVDRWTFVALCDAFTRHVPVVLSCCLLRMLSSSDGLTRHYDLLVIW